jgi:hypothetical protein
LSEPADALTTIAALRTALVARLRILARCLEKLPLAAEVVTFLERATPAFEQHAALALERPPADPR